MSMNYIQSSLNKSNAQMTSNFEKLYACQPQFILVYDKILIDISAKK